MIRQGTVFHFAPVNDGGALGVGAGEILPSSNDSSLPIWAESLLRLGEILYRQRTCSIDIQVCLSLPTRSMAAALVSCGASLASLIDERPEPIEDHFEELSKTGSGAPITVLKGAKLRSGWLEGPTEIMGQECIGYMEHRTHGDERRYLYKERCLDIQLMPTGSKPFAVAKNPFEDPSTPTVLDTIGLGAASAAASRFECAAVVFTKISKLEDELDQRLDLAGSSAVPLVDIVRPKRFLSRGVPYRTHLVPSSSDDLPSYTEDYPPVAVFDGSQGYLRLRHHVDATALLLLLDRWDTNVKAGVSAFISENVGATFREDLPGFVPVAGMELIAFEAAR